MANAMTGTGARRLATVALLGALVASAGARAEDGWIARIGFATAGACVSLRF